jgi:hypothetical protein
MTRTSRLTMYECTGLQIVENFISWWNVDTEINSKPGWCYLIQERKGLIFVYRVS